MATKDETEFPEPIEVGEAKTLAVFSSGESEAEFVGQPSENLFIEDKLPIDSIVQPQQEAGSKDIVFFSDGTGSLVFPNTLLDPKGLSLIEQYGLDIDPEIGLDPNGRPGDFYLLTEDIDDETGTSRYTVTNITKQDIVLSTNDLQAAIDVRDFLVNLNDEAVWTGNFEPERNIIPLNQTILNLPDASGGNFTETLTALAAEFNNLASVYNDYTLSLNEIRTAISFITESAIDYEQGLTLKEAKNSDPYERALLINQIKTLGALDQLIKEMSIPTDLGE